VQVWDTQSRIAAGKIGNHKQDIWAIKFSHDRQHLATASNDNTIKLWRWNPTGVDDVSPNWKIPLNAVGFADKMTFTPKDNRLLTVGEDNSVMVWDAGNGKLLHTLSGHTGHVFAVAVSHDGELFASGGADTTIRLWDATQDPPMEVYKLRGHTNLISSLAFSPNDDRLVSGSRDKTVKVWDLTELKELRDGNE
jgi:WD40 repeat protein